ncbi:hypothetical protein BSLG_009045 [Batrachochytrium salamandrivorans]|nr:hypothetical protein BSLG_009045 [Batrachochytrium salamandrivorans]
MAGFYRSSYTTKEGEKKHLVVTQFEATDCRRALPSWDEPNLKATFDLLAFAVGDFEFIETMAHPTLPADAKPITCRMDMIAIPDFGAGAMENWVSLPTVKLYWWSELWLNEGFATFVGASVIRMLSSFLGTDSFVQGVRAYLKKFAFSNATTLDFVTDETFDEAKQELTVTVRQSRFLSSGNLSPRKMPKVYGASRLRLSPTPTHIAPLAIYLRRRKPRSPSHTHTSGHFWKFNYKTTGFYRVNLDTKQQAHLGAALSANLKSFTTEDRIGIIADAFATAKAGTSSTSGALDIIKGFSEEDDYIVLQELSGSLEGLTAILLNEPQSVLDGVAALKRQLFSAKAKAMGFEYSDKEGHLTHLKRTLLIKAAADAKDPFFIEELTKRFHKFIAGDETALHSNLRTTAYRTVSKNTEDESTFDAFNMYKTTTAVEARLMALASLGSSPNMNVVQRVLNEVVLDKELVRLQDIAYPMQSLRGSPALKEVLPIMWTFLKSNWPVLYERLKPTLGLLGASVTICVGGQIGMEFADEVEAWSRGDELTTAEEKATRVEQLKAAKRPLDQSLERIRSSTKWLERDRAAIAEWLAANKF